MAQHSPYVGNGKRRATIAATQQGHRASVGFGYYYLYFRARQHFAQSGEQSRQQQQVSDRAKTQNADFQAVPRKISAHRRRIIRQSVFQKTNQFFALAAEENQRNTQPKIQPPFDYIAAFSHRLPSILKYYILRLKFLFLCDKTHIGA
jgi:hypothetical protein